MKYKRQTMPEREANLWEMKLKGNDKVQFDLVYTKHSKNQQTFVRQPVVISLCTMKRLCVNAHKILDQLEDRLLAARREMQGER